MRRRFRLSKPWLLVCFLFLLYGVATLAPIHAQSGAEVRVQDLERRVTDLEGDHAAERLTRLETLMDTNNHLLLGVFGAVALMLIERAIRLRRPRGEWSD